jgi:peptidoglycan-N-acetylglucosamine deacetylase
VQNLALTFDDGPDRVHTPRLLDLLAQAGATATFFPIAPRAAAHPGIVARMRDEGHSVGLHCNEHLRHHSRDRAWCERDTDLALARLRALRVRPAIWRTPWGELAPWTEQVAGQRGLRLVGWDVDTHDWRGDSAADMFAATRSSLGPGAIVLAHDGLGPGARRATVGETIDYTARVLEHAATHGIAVRALA